MTDHSGSHDYDWDEHFRVADQLNELDIYSLQLTGARPMTQGAVQNHLTAEFTDVARARRGVSPAELYNFITQSLRRVVVLANEHAELSASRAHAMVNYITELSQLFPEENWGEQARREIKMRGDQLIEIKRGLHCTGVIYQNEGVVYQDDTMWTSSIDAVEISVMQYKDLCDRPLPSYTDQFPRMRALTLAGQQEGVAAISLDHARVQTNLIDECLRLATSIRLLPEQYGAKLHGRMESLALLAHDLVINAACTLDEGADLRNSSQLSKNIQRPIFSCPAP